MEERTTPALGRAYFATRNFAAGEVVLQETPFLVFAGAADVVNALPSLPPPVQARVADLWAPSEPFSAAYAAALRDRNLPTSGPRARAAAAVDSNAFQWGPAALALFDRASIFAHSCAPNVVFGAKTAEKTATFRTLREVAAGELLALDYLGSRTLWGTAARRRHLQRTKFFWCMCPRCCGCGAQYARDETAAVACPRCHAPSGAAPLNGGDCERRAWQCAACGATLCDADFGADFAARLEKLETQAADIDVSVACGDAVDSADAVSLLDVRSLRDEARTLLGDSHWTTLTLELALFDVLAALLLRSSSPSPRGLAELSDILSRLDRWQPPACLPAGFVLVGGARRATFAKLTISK